MEKFVKNPVVVEAVQFLGIENATEIVNWVLENGGTARYQSEESPFVSDDGKTGHDGWPEELHISTLEGDMRASVGDYIIRGIKGEFYPCKPDIFEESYSSIIDPATSIINSFNNGD